MVRGLQMRDISAKQRVIKLIDILRSETDEANQLGINELIDKLEWTFSIEGGIDFKIDKRAIKEDINEIRASGFSVSDFTDVKAKGKILYYHDERLFEIYELRLLIDAVRSARFITKEETEKIVEKLKTLTSKGLAKKLENRIYTDEMIKSENKQLKYYVDQLHSAIAESKKVSFQYGNYNINKEFVLHRQGGLYKVQPHTLVWNNDFYYLVCFDESRGAFINYRVDRMRSVEKLEEKFERLTLDVAKYLKQSFNMYPGKGDLVEIQFKNKLVNAVIDKLGVHMESNVVDEEHFKIRFRAAINEGLLRWVLMWGADAKVLKPEQLIQMLKNESCKMQDIYK